MKEPSATRVGRFRDQLREQRWDDHRYYHHSIVNQSLHFISAITFIVAYAIVWRDPGLAALLAWGVAMVSRQAGHFFFEPKSYDEQNDCTHEHKEEIKVGYNLVRKVVLMSLWALSPFLLVAEPSLFGLVAPYQGAADFLEKLGVLWLLLGAGAITFRTVQLFFIRDVSTGLVWATKIMTDPFNDFCLYRRAPAELARRAIAWRPARAR